jgi:hypothetical protein
VRKGGAVYVCRVTPQTAPRSYHRLPCVNSKFKLKLGIENLKCFIEVLPRQNRLMDGHAHGSGGGCGGSGGSAPPAATHPACCAPKRPEEDDSFLVHREAPPSAEERERASFAAALREARAPVPEFASSAAPPLAPPFVDSLPAAWLRAEALFHHIEDGGPENCPDAEHSPPAHVAAALAAFSGCADAVRRAALFSDNEAVEDVATPHLRYLLAEYYVAALLLRTESGPARAPSLRAARAGFEAFARVCVQLGAVTAAEDVRALLGDEERAQCGEDEEGALGRPSGGGGGGGGASRARLPPRRDPGALRAAKIERFRRNQAAKKRLAELAAAHAAAAARARAAGAEGDADGVSGAASMGGGAGDEDAAREAALLTIACAVRDACDSAAAIDLELPLLAMREEAEAREGCGDARRECGGGGGGQQADGRAPPRGPPPGDLSIDPARPGLQVTRINPSFEITKETVKAGIFQSFHRCAELCARFFLGGHAHLTSFLTLCPSLFCRPPTMSMEEWGEQVLAMTREREAREKQQAAAHVSTLSELQVAGREDDEKAWDAATEKKRAFEDWADGVPFGSGNTKRI